MFGNPFLKTASDLAILNKQQIANQEKSNSMTEPYFVGEVYKTEHPSETKQLTTEIKKEAKHQLIRDIFASKQLYNIKQLTNQSLEQQKENADNLINRISPALTGQLEGELPPLIGEQPLSMKMAKFVKSMYSLSGSDKINGIPFKTSTSSNLPLELKQFKDENPEEYANQLKDIEPIKIGNKKIPVQTSVDLINKWVK